MINFTRIIGVKEDLPEGEHAVIINVTLHNPPELLKFKGEDVVFMTATANVTLEKLAEALMRIEVIYKFENVSEKIKAEKTIKEKKKLPEDIEKKLMNNIGARAILMLVKSHNELGIPPPVPLPRF